MLKSTFALSALFTGTIPLLAEGSSGVQAQGSMFQTLMMIGLAIVFFYFILWRPEQKRKKAMEQLRGSLKKGDKITAMGIVGTVVKVQETTVIVALYEGAKMELLKGSITDVQASAEGKVIESSEVK